MKTTPRSLLTAASLAVSVVARSGRCAAAAEAAFVVVRPPASSSSSTSSGSIRPPRATSVLPPPPVSTGPFAPPHNRAAGVVVNPAGGAVGGPLYAIVDVPPGFFTTMFVALGLTNTLIRKVQREALKEQAWRSRIEESREARLADDPTLSEIDLIREEADARPRPYGEEARERREREERMGRRPRVITIEDGPGSSQKRYKRDEYGESGSYRPMTDDEIDDFEVVYGVSYDPYYDEPYEEDELPDDVKYRVDRLYGDRRYEDGEVFYRDESTGLYWRQGCKPRAKRTWSVS